MDLKEDNYFKEKIQKNRIFPNVYFGSKPMVGSPLTAIIGILLYISITLRQIKTTRVFDAYS